MFPAAFFLAVALVAVSNVAALGPLPVLLGTARNYAILAKSGVSSVPNSFVTGAVGLSPAAATFLTGFSVTMSPTNSFSTSTQVVGQLTAGNYAAPTPAILTTAVADMATAYADASGRLLPTFTNIHAGALGGQILLPGLYKFTTAVGASADFTLLGTPVDTWIFQVAGGLSVAAAKRAILVGGLNTNVVWAVAGIVSLEAGAHLEGVILANGAVTLKTGSSLSGRILSKTAVSLQQATVTQPLL